MVSRAAWLYIVLVAAATGALVAVAYKTQAHFRMPLLDLVVLQVLFLVCDFAKTPLTSRQTKWSPSSAATLAAVVLLGPVAAALVGAASLISPRRRLLLAERLFNGAMHALSGLAAGLTYVALNGPVGLPKSAEFQPLLVAFAVAATVHVLANQTLIWGIYRLNRGSGMLRREGLE